MLERIVELSVVGCAEWDFIAHQVDDGCSWRDEEYLHASVVYTHEVHEKIDIAHTENKQVHLLCLAWQADAVPFIVDSVEQKHDS